MSHEIRKVIGRAEKIHLPELGYISIPAKVDTGAKTSAIWASNIHERDGGLAFTLFAPGSPYYTGEEHFSPHFTQVVVASSIGTEEGRYKVVTLVKLRGKKVRSSFTLADRSKQAYPVLIGRNVLRGKFLVDVKSGRPDVKAEVQRSKQLQSLKQEQHS
jgi:hypothetical protein